MSNTQLTPLQLLEKHPEELVDLGLNKPEVVDQIIQAGLERFQLTDSMQQILKEAIALFLPKGPNQWFIRISFLDHVGDDEATKLFHRANSYFPNPHNAGGTNRINHDPLMGEFDISLYSSHLPQVQRFVNLCRYINIKETPDYFKLIVSPPNNSVYH